MNPEISSLEQKIIWLVGATERLATLGLLYETPLKITQNTIDLFLEIDEYRDHLLKDEYELIDILKTMIVSESEEEVDNSTIQEITKLVLEYKNNRTELVKFALSRAQTV